MRGTTHDGWTGADALERAVEADIRAELAAHLELAAEALEAQRHAPHEARALAAERFGDMERTVRACRRAKLGGRIVMQRLNLVGTLALLAAVLFFGVRSQALMERVAVSAAALDRRVSALEGETPTPPPAPVDAIVIGVGDVVETLDRHRDRDWGEMERVGPDGKILLMDLGWINVAGLTRDELTEQLNEAYSAYYEDLAVDVRVTPADRRSNSAELRTIVVGVGDTIELVEAYHPEELACSERVAVDGTVLLPDLGHVQVAGLTRAQLEALLSERYAAYYDELDLNARVLPAE